MAIAAGRTALSAYLIGTLINEAYVSHNFRGIVILGIAVDGDLRRQRLGDLRSAP